MSAPREAADLLDTMANPHPRLMQLARWAWTSALDADLTTSAKENYWHGVRDAMAAATGETTLEIERRVREWSP